MTIESRTISLQDLIIILNSRTLTIHTKEHTISDFGEWGTNTLLLLTMLLIFGNAGYMPSFS